MKIKRQTLTFTSPPQSLCWDDTQLIDWVGGGCTYQLNGDFGRSGRIYSYRFDAAIQLVHGDDYYAVIYEKLGTKGLLLKNGENIREINRSYYHACTYEYPIAFLILKNGKLAIAHCPNEYNLLEIEEVESGKKITNSERETKDCFISRLRVNASNTHMINAGWVWHPVDILEVFDIEKGLTDHSVFDEWPDDFMIDGEVASAEFLDNDFVLVSNGDVDDGEEEEVKENILPPMHIGLLSLEKNKWIKKTKVNAQTGTLIPLNKDYALSLLEYPKLIDLNSGKVVQKIEDIYSGEQQTSIIHHIEKIPPIATDIPNNRIAIGTKTGIEVLTWN
ncbi:MAG TPA: hypothetical protein ENK52_01390 [Saprospiraceae bacterium]|nr:hypothetical protein [Saprospiraceae bacterium]